MPKLFQEQPREAKKSMQASSIIPHKYPFWAKFWFSWLVLTAIYLSLFTYLFTTKTSESLAQILTKTLDFLGLFVPFKADAFGLMMSDFFELLSGHLPSTKQSLFEILSVAILIFFLYKIDSFIKKYFFSSAIKLLINLSILFVLTILIDLAIWGYWPVMLFNGLS